jgi:hypothetical protein
MSNKIDPAVIFARGFVKAFGVDCGRHLEAIAPTIGLSIEQVPATTFDGALVRVAGHPVGKVLLKRGIRESGRKLFTLAHELGHYVLPTHAKSGAVCRSTDIDNWSPGLPPREIEANRFAAEILMPKELILEELRQEPSLHNVRLLAVRFGTTFAASTYRLVELTSYRSALVWSVSGRRIWYKPSEEFGRAVELGEVSPGSFAADCFRGEPVPDHAESVAATAWLYESGLAEGARIFEESAAMPYYDAVLSLLTISGSHRTVRTRQRGGS